MKLLSAFAAFLFAAPVFAQQLMMVAGNGQVTSENFGLLSPMTVRAVDAAGRPLSGVPVTWRVSQGEGTLQMPSASTDAAGLATSGYINSFIQADSWATATVTASTATSSVPFFVTVIKGGFGTSQPHVELKPNKELTGPAGTVIRDAFQVAVAAMSGPRAGQGIPNVGIRIVPAASADTVNGPGAQCEGPGGIPLTNEVGVATCHLILNGNPGVLSFRVIAGEAYSAGGDQSVTITPSQCNTTLNPTALSLPGVGGSRTVSVTTASGCSWTPSSSVQWITFGSGAAVTGSGQVTVNVAANPGAQRTGTVTIGSSTLTVTQAAAGSTSTLTFQTNPTLPPATAGLSYAVGVTATGGQAPYTYTASATLPPGLSLNSGTGTISGTPTQAGGFSIPVTVRDITGATASQTFTLTVNVAGSGGGISIGTASFPNGTLAVAYSQTIVVSSNCANPFSSPRIEIVSGSLPPGLTLQGVSGTNRTAIAGTPTQTGTFRFALRAVDACSASSPREFTLTIGDTSQVTPAMAASPASVSFVYERGSTTTPPPPQAVVITAGALPTAFTFTTQSEGATWFTVTASQSTTPASLTISALDIAVNNLPPGIYRGSVVITSGAPNSPFTIPVTLEIRAGTAITVAPTSLVFNYELGGAAPAAQTITVQGSSTGLYVTPVITTSTGATWLSVTPSANVTPGTFNVSVNPASLAADTYTGSIGLQLQDGRTPVTVPVSLIVTARGPQIGSVVSGASFLAGPIAPGEIVTIFGTSMGPATLTTFLLTPAGTIDTLLSNVRVWLDDQPAPLLHVSERQITVIAPYTLAGKNTARLQVEYNGTRSVIREVPVAPSAPSLFTIGGQTQGAILNQDSTINSAQNAAQAGSIVSIYATGEGETTPASVAGDIISATALAKPVLPVSVTIGGREAEILYAGSAPGLPAGMMQVNARIPAETAAGPAPVVLKVGASSSQPNVTVAVRQ